MMMNNRYQFSLGIKRYRLNVGFVSKFKEALNERDKKRCIVRHDGGLS